MTEEALLAKTKAIHERVITLDTHCDINLKNFTDSVNYTQDLDNQVSLPKMKKGGLDVAWFIVYTGQDSLTDAGYVKAYENAISKFAAIHRLVTDYAPDEIELATSSEDVRRINAEGKKVAMIGIENGYPVGLDIVNVKKFYDLIGLILPKNSKYSIWAESESALISSRSNHFTPIESAIFFATSTSYTALASYFSVFK